MWLALDIGNSAIKGGLFRNGEIVSEFRIDLEQMFTAEGWRKKFHDVLVGFTIERIGIASVVPAITEAIRSPLQRVTGRDPLVFSHHVLLPFDLAYRTPETLGIDRLAAAAGAWTRYGHGEDGSGRNVIVIDAGTAVTCEVIEKSGRYLGGVISPGPRLVIRALSQGTAQLPPVDAVLPESLIGRSTREAIQSGIMYGFVDSITGMITRLKGLLGAPCYSIVTGGWGALLKTETSGIDVFVPDLVLLGIYDLMVLNRD